MVTIEKIEIPAGVEVSMSGDMVVVKGPKGELQRSMYYPNISIVIEDGHVVISTGSGRKTVYAMVGTFASHIHNMCIGVTVGYEFSMKVVYSHFPIQLKLHPGILEIGNFLGEKMARNAKIHNGVTVMIGSDEVTVTGIDKEKVGNTAANIEKATKIRKRDPRVFQDGIYRVQKA
ncbi:MAG: 50S ribosomal protein L6 [Methanocalculus sp.]|uniref:50S ribosomal protein L6 n=1 Tax=Methanocalculus sp. TaxID=2004547 RepID=UPI002722F900|nr:50S ribosomal protein L6 [Methanocalculus sp.]MDO8841081.1 50S ribosomal protein L6 [Methanocalculus sp.]MDO9538444.1 50S ribosomal protein L6 [Methanocalculus sp.]